MKGKYKFENNQHESKEEKYQVKEVGIWRNVDKAEYTAIRKNQRRKRYLRETKKGVTVVSLEALAEREFEGVDVIKDDRTNVAEEAIHNVMLEKMREAQESLTDEEKILIDMHYFQNITQDEMEEILDIPQSTISYRIKKAIKKMRKLMGIKNL